MNKMLKSLLFISFILISQSVYCETTKYASYDEATGTWIDLGIEAPDNVICTIEYQGKLVVLTDLNQLYVYNDINSSWDSMDIVLPADSIEIKSRINEVNDEFLLTRTSSNKIHSLFMNNWITYSFDVPKSANQILSHYMFGILSNNIDAFLYDPSLDQLEYFQNLFPLPVKEFITLSVDSFLLVTPENDVYTFMDEFESLKLSDIALPNNYCEIFALSNQLIIRK